MIEKQKNKSGQIQMVSVDSLVPEHHLLRKINRVMDFRFIYDLVENKYCKDNGRPAVDPIVLVKMVFIQHLFGIRSLRQTAKEVEVNIAYRWFIGYDFTDKIPHFSTLSYNFLHKFTSETFEEIFTHILEQAIKRGFIKAETIFIDATHIKANANKHKKHKETAKIGARIYDVQLRQEINEDRKGKGKKPIKDDDDDDMASSSTREITVSDVDPDSGIFRKGEHKVEFAYTTHTACDKNGFILGTVTTAGNMHDSKVFDEIYDRVTEKFNEVETVAADSAYKTPWICKRIFNDNRNPSMPYKRPMSKKEFFKPYEYVYDEYYDCVICPNNQVLKYATTSKNGYREFKSNPKICAKCLHLKKCTHSINQAHLAGLHRTSGRFQAFTQRQRNLLTKESNH